MQVHVPAMRGKMGSRTYYACLMPLEAIQNMFKFDPDERQWTDLTPEQREQRALNKTRIPAITSYIIENEDDYLFASITASYKSEPVFIAAPGVGDGDNIGTLKIKLGDELTINDGQHRCAAIVEALRKNPNLGEQTISVLLFPWESTGRVQQMFTDLNRHVVKTSKSLDVLFDRRDPISTATMFALDKVPVFKELTEKVDASLKAKSSKIFTLAAIYDANSDLLKDQQEDDIEGNAKRLVEYWSTVAANMADWNKVLSGHKLATELRSESISAHSTVLRALGGLGADLMKEGDWKDRLSSLSSIDWSKNNPEWQNVCIVANSVVSNRQARAATKAFIKGKLKLELSDAEKRITLKAALQDAVNAAFRDTNTKPTDNGANGDGAWSGDGVTLPHGTSLRMRYNDRLHEGAIVDGKWVVDGETFDSPSGAASGIAITKEGKRTRLDGWVYWEAKLPGDEAWRRIASLRSSELTLEDLDL